MDNLPTTLQGMKDYVRGAKNTIKREKKRIEDLEIAIGTLAPKIVEIEKQLKNSSEDNIEQARRQVG